MYTASNICNIECLSFNTFMGSINHDHDGKQSSTNIDIPKQICMSDCFYYRHQFVETAPYQYQQYTAIRIPIMIPNKLQILDYLQILPYRLWLISPIQISTIPIPICNCPCFSYQYYLFIPTPGNGIGMLALIWYQLNTSGKPPL